MLALSPAAARGFLSLSGKNSREFCSHLNLRNQTSSPKAFQSSASLSAIQLFLRRYIRVSFFWVALMSQISFTYFSQPDSLGALLYLSCLFLVILPFYKLSSVLFSLWKTIPTFLLLSLLPELIIYTCIIHIHITLPCRHCLKMEKIKPGKKKTKGKKRKKLKRLKTSLHCPLIWLHPGCCIVTVLLLYYSVKKWVEEWRKNGDINTSS